MRLLDITRRLAGRVLLAVALAGFVAAVTAAPAVAAAANEQGDGHDHGAKDGGKKEDKLGFLGLKRYDLGIYTLIVFGLLIFVLSKYAWPHIAAGLKKREAAIIGARDEAQKSLQEAQELRAKLQRDQAEAAERMRAEFERARKEAEAIIAQAREAAARQAAELKAQGERDIEAAKTEALAQIYREAVDLATTLSAKTLARNISADDHRRLMDDALTELKQTTRTA